MSTFNFNSAEEMRRNANISKFLEGLLDEDCNNLSRNNYLHPATSEKVPEMKVQKVSQILNLPESELAAYKEYPGLLEANKEIVLKIPFSIHSIKHSDTLVKIYTGIPVAKGFFNLANRFHKASINYYSGWVVGLLTVKQQLLLTLMKLKLGMDDIHLSHRFQCSLETVRNTVFTWLFALHEKLYNVVGNLRDQWTGKEPVLIDTVTLHTKGPKTRHIPHKAPLEPYAALIVVKGDGVVLDAGEMYAWINEKADIINESDFFRSLQPGNVVALDSDVSEFVDMPDGVRNFSFDVGAGKMMKTREDLERRLSEYQAFRCIHPEIEE